MADIFLAYADEDREVARKLCTLLESAGWSVWWDKKIPGGQTWRAHIYKALTDMRCMVVLWSATSIESDWVQEEAEEARSVGKLVPVLIAPVEPPVGFRAIQAADLVNWNGSAQAPGFRQFLSDVEALLGKRDRVVTRKESWRDSESNSTTDKCKVFLSYRRDSAAYAKMIHSALVQRLSKQQVFMDVDALPAGADFLQHIKKAVSECNVLVAIIGREWATGSTGGSPARINDPEDVVRLEIAMALDRNVRVIPVLVDGVTMPNKDILPADLKAFTSRNALEISNTRLDYDVERVVTAVSGPSAGALASLSRWFRSRPAILAAATIILCVLSLRSCLVEGTEVVARTGTHEYLHSWLPPP